MSMIGKNLISIMGKFWSIIDTGLLGSPVCNCWNSSTPCYDFDAPFPWKSAIQNNAEVINLLMHM